jgi:hypothetical protein
MTGEKRLERNFCAWCKERDIVPVKGPANLAKGIPDRFLGLPSGGGTIYVEFKGSSYYGLQPMQMWWQEYLLDSSLNRYFVIDNDEDLANLKSACEKFIAIGAKLVAYETQLLKELEE